MPLTLSLSPLREGKGEGVAEMGLRRLKEEVFSNLLLCRRGYAVTGKKNRKEILDEIT